MSKCWYCNEELTTANYCEDHMGICNKCYSEMFQGNKVVKWWTDKITDLEAKLAESEKKFIIANNLRKNADEVLLNYKTEKYGLDKTIQELRKIKLSFPEKEWYYKGFENCERQMSSHIADLTLEVKQLKQQLAESEEDLKATTESLYASREYLDQLKSEKWALEKQLAEKEKEIKELTECNQYLQIYRNQDKISFAVERLEKVKDHYRKFKNTNMGIIKRADIVLFIDNQIEEIKKEIK